MSVDKLPLKAYAVSLVTIDATQSGSSSATACGVKGIRAARFVLGDTLNASLVRSKETWDQACVALGDGQPVIIGSSDSQKVAGDAAKAAESESQGVLRCEVGQSAERPQEAAESLTEGVVEFDCPVYQLEMCDECGNTTSAVGDGTDACQHNGKTTFKDVVLTDDILNGAVSSRASAGVSWEAIAYALTALAIAGGNANGALTITRAFAKHKDPETWGEAGGMLRAALIEE